MKKNEMLNVRLFKGLVGNLFSLSPLQLISISCDGKTYLWEYDPISRKLKLDKGYVSLVLYFKFFFKTQRGYILFQILTAKGLDSF